MNKLLIAAALLAASALPAVPASAATMAMTMPAPTAAQCKLMPMLMGCPMPESMMKAAPAPAAPKVAVVTTKPAMPMMSMPTMAMPMWWTCVKAPAGSGHLLDCTPPK